MSLLNAMGLPPQFGITLLLFFFALTLVPFFAGKDFGILKIPEFGEMTRQRLRRAAPALLFCAIVLHLPIYSSPGTDREDLDEKKLSAEESVESPPTEQESIDYEDLVLDLKKEVGILRGTWENDDLGETSRSVVASKAAPLGDRLSRVADSNLGIGAAITKHEYCLYAYLMAADVETSSIKAAQYANLGIEHGNVALGLVEEAIAKDNEDRYSRAVVDWLLEVGMRDRLNFLISQTMAIEYRTGKAHAAFEARKRLQLVSSQFKEYYKYKENRILLPILSLGEEPE